MKLFKVEGQSMTPSIEDGQYVIVRKKKRYKYNDIIVFTFDHRYYVKRVQSVYQDGYFVLGDCFSSSVDSRTMGLINSKDIIGSVLVVI
ncbi:MULTISPECIES: S26 family signal peptidase [Kandleria]|jgi:nickel-type superoxide dismutase maturation protease|uniref:Peptidase S24/S26A/S26B/S26C domain-containing protein n=2 Tax=Kandleria vitulina TaxID=1630 RepID=A0A0R2HDR3_9FIRM|nr:MULTISPECIES: S26 family signal peptidase [Kandleria]KRN51183.1 hypothetical protein IV49_GL000644 [Kandleria vitulina DSM 20405]MBP3275315.1 S26 family signal peptidase [Kandleria sp.]MEE0989410.1 S26 family signal peptidase [Kandleria vitulina]